MKAHRKGTHTRTRLHLGLAASLKWCGPISLCLCLPLPPASSALVPVPVLWNPWISGQERPSESSGYPLPFTPDKAEGQGDTATCPRSHNYFGVLVYLCVLLLSILFVFLVCVCKTDTERQSHTKRQTAPWLVAEGVQAQKHSRTKREVPSAALAWEEESRGEPGGGGGGLCHDVPGLVCQCLVCWLEEAPHQR